jgi:hypothetical protein
VRRSLRSPAQDFADSGLGHQLTGYLSFDKHTLLLEIPQFIISERRSLGLQHFGIDAGILIEQRVEMGVVGVLLLDVFLRAAQILIKVMVHRHGTPPFVDRWQPRFIAITSYQHGLAYALLSTVYQTNGAPGSRLLQRFRQERPGAALFVYCDLVWCTACNHADGSSWERSYFLSENPGYAR